MLKRIVLFLALSAALVACSSSGTTSTSGAGESVAPVESGAASGLPSDSGLESTRGSAVIILPLKNGKAVPYPLPSRES